MKAELADGTILEFPDGTDPAVIQQTVKRVMAESPTAEFAQRAAQMDPMDLSVARSKNDPFGDYLRGQAQRPVDGETEDARSKRLYGEIPKPDRPGTGEGLTRGYLQGGTFGFGDEIVAGGAAAIDALGSDASFGEAYDMRLANERNKVNQFREDSPVLAYGSEIVGAIPTSIAPVFNAARGGQYANAIRTGAGQGFAYGFGQGEGDAANRVESGAMVGALSGLGGAAAIPLSKGVGNLVNRTVTAKQAKTIGMTGPEYKILDRAMRADDAMTGEGARRMAMAGDDAMLADAGSGAQRLLDTAIVKSPPAARVATGAVEGRATGAGQRLTAVLDSTLGEPKGIRATSKGIAQGTSAARGDAYRAAYDTPIDYASDAGSRIESALSRIPDRIKKEAIDSANEEMISQGAKNQQIIARVADDGSIELSEMPNVEQLDQIKRALGRMAADQKDELTGKVSSAGQMYSRLARDLKSAVSDAVPDYAAAVKLGGDKIERDNALLLGRDLLKRGTTREVVAEAAADMSDEARQAAAQGLRSYIDDALAEVKIAMTDTNVDAREAFKLVRDLSSRANKEKIRILLGDDVADQVLRQVDRATKAFELRAGVARGSATAIRQSTADDVSQMVEGGAVNRLREGELVQGPKAMVSAILGRSPEAKQRISDKVYLSIVEALTGPRGAEARVMLEQLQGIQPLIDQRTGKVIDLTQGILSRNAPVVAPMTEALGAR